MSKTPLSAITISRPQAMHRLLLVLITLYGMCATTVLQATEIDEVFNGAIPAFYEHQTGKDGVGRQPIANTRSASDFILFSTDDCNHESAEVFHNRSPFASPIHFDVKRDYDAFLPMLRDDARAIVNWNNAAILGGALATSLAFRQDLDGRISRSTAQHPDRWGEGSKNLGRMGEVQYHVAAIAVLYGVSIKRSDAKLHEFTKTLVSAYIINGLSTLTIKGIANTDRPSDEWSGGHFGFPSFHTSSTFTMAAVIDEYYGPGAGLPAYALAGLIGWSRIDERAHDLSDVFFGAALGYVIGHAVAGEHLRCDSRVRVLPYIHPTEGTSGLMVDLSF